MNNMIVAERDQMMLMPPSIREWLPQDHLAVFVADIVDRLDLSEIEQQYKGSGEWDLVCLAYDIRRLHQLKAA